MYDHAGGPIRGGKEYPSNLFEGNKAIMVQYAFRNPAASRADSPLATDIHQPLVVPAPPRVSKWKRVAVTSSVLVLFVAMIIIAARVTTKAKSSDSTKQDTTGFIYPTAEGNLDSATCPSMEAYSTNSGSYLDGTTTALSYGFEERNCCGTCPWVRISVNACSSNVYEYAMTCCSSLESCAGAVKFLRVSQADGASLEETSICKEGFTGPVLVQCTTLPAGVSTSSIKYRGKVPLAIAQIDPLGGAAAAGTATVPLQPPLGALVWEENFDGVSLDTDVWETFVDVTARENELQIFNQNNVKVDGGVLVIEARKDIINDSPAYTSGKISTIGGRSLLYGHLQIRAQMASWAGCWPSLWLSEFPSGYGASDLQGVEVTIAQTTAEGKTPLSEIQFLSGASTTPLVEQCGCTSDNGVDYSNGFHLYEISKAPSALEWRIDGKVVCRCTNLSSGTGGALPYDTPLYFGMSLSLGGKDSSSGSNIIDDSALPTQLIVDYIRQYDLAQSQLEAGLRSSVSLPVGESLPYNTEAPGGPLVPWRLPCSLSAESYDAGGEGVSYHDTTPGNTGNSDLRLGDSVDLSQETRYVVPEQRRERVSHGAFITDTEPLEWWSYTINTLTSSTLSGAVWASASLTEDGWATGSLIGLLDTTNCEDPLPSAVLFEVDVPPPHEYPALEAWNELKWGSDIRVPAGVHRIVVCTRTGGVNWTQLDLNIDDPSRMLRGS